MFRKNLAEGTPELLALLLTREAQCGIRFLNGYMLNVMKNIILQ